MERCRKFTIKKGRSTLRNISKCIQTLSVSSHFALGCSGAQESERCGWLQGLRPRLRWPEPPGSTHWRAASLIQSERYRPETGRQASVGAEKWTTVKRLQAKRLGFYDKKRIFVKLREMVVVYILNSVLFALIPLMIVYGHPLHKSHDKSLEIIFVQPK